MKGLPFLWHINKREQKQFYPCDLLVEEPTAAFWRAVSVKADVPHVFRWLCQLKAAPYSYDLLDNLGRKSPQELTPGLEELTRGDRVMHIFRLEDFGINRHLTLVNVEVMQRITGRVAATYAVFPDVHGGTRLTVKLLVRTNIWLYPPLSDWLLGWVDLFMMRKQLLNLKRLAEETKPS